jgi:hypothetical protein
MPRTISGHILREPALQRMKQRLALIAAFAALPACIDDPDAVELAEEEQEILNPCIVTSPGTTTAVRDGGFESSPSSWTFSGVTARRVNDGFARCGSYYALLTGTGFVRQRIVVPNDSRATLRVHLNVTTTEPVQVWRDRLYAYAILGDGTWRMLGLPRSNLDATDAGRYAAYEYGLGSLAGQTLWLQLSSGQDSIYPTTFRLDDVSIVVPLVNTL